MTNKLSLDNAGISLLALSKDKLTESARQLQSKHDKLTEYQMLYKLQFLIKTRLEMIKDDCKETFLEKFGGSKSEKINGFQITLKEMMEYNYSEDVTNLESEIKLLSEQLKQMKENEKRNGKAITGVTEKEILSFTLK